MYTIPTAIEAPKNQEVSPMHGIHKLCVIPLLLLSVLRLSCATQAVQNDTPSGTRSPVVSPEVMDVTTEAPLPDVTPQPNEAPMLRLAVISDMNGRYGSAEYDPEVVKGIDKIIEEHPDIVINVGDMVAGQKAKLNYRKMWAGFHETVTNRLKEAGIPMAQVVGNHDGSAYERYANERAIYIDEWNQHKPDLEYVDDSQYPLYYAFTLKGVLFIGLDVSTLDPLSEEQFTWLENQLKNNPTQTRPVVFFHVPLFPITTIKPTEICRDSRLEELLSRHRVQLVLNGHQQAYFPAHLNGVTYVHAGALGGGPRPVRQNDGIAPKTLTFVNLYPTHDPYIDSHLLEGQNGEHFNHNLLPTYIVFGNRILPRLDISLEDAQFAHEYMISPHMTKTQMITLIEALRANGGDWGRIPDWTATSPAPAVRDLPPDSAEQ